MFQRKKKGTEKVKKYILRSVDSFEKRAFYETVLKNIVETDRPKMTIWRMRIACWIPNSKNTHSQYVILTAFSLKEWLKKRSTVFRYSTLAVFFRLS